MRARWGRPYRPRHLDAIGRRDIVRTHPGLAARIAGAGAMTLDDFTPRLSAKRWAKIGPFVRDAAVSAAPQTPYAAHKLAVTLVSYVDWAHFSQGLPLEAPLLFRHEVIARYINDKSRTTKLAEGTLRNYRAMLHRVSAALLPSAAPVPVAPLNSRSHVPPYTDSEIRMAVAWMRGQPGEIRPRKAAVMMSLCLGAGLRSREVAELRAKDVHIVDAGVLIRLPDRDVPVVMEWESPLRRVIENLEPDEYVFGDRTRVTTRNLLSSFVDNTAGHFRPRSDRLRATWIVNHLCNGIDLRTLMKAAGITKFLNLHRYLEYVPEPDHATYRSRLRGEVS